MGLSSVLPFLAALQKQQGISPSTFQQGADEPAALSGGPVDMSGPDPRNFDVGSGTSVPPAGPIAQQPVSQLPDVGTGEPQAAPEDKGNALRQPYESKGHALLRILQSGLVGGLSGLSQNAATYAATGRNAGFGGGVGAGFTQSLPMQAAFQQLGLQKAGLENQQLIQMLPFLRANAIAGLQKTSAEAQKFGAEANKATAEAGAIPVKTQLEQAQANAAKFQKVGDSLYDISGSTPQMVAGSTAILDEPTARILGKQPGDVVPLDVATKGKQLADQGLSYTQANGHNWLVDKQGNKLKDMGVATPIATINASMNAPAQVTPQMQQVAAQVASGNLDLQTALGPFRRFPGQAEALINEVYNQNPNFNQATYGTSKDTLKYFTTGAGGTQLTAFRTAIAHAELLKQAAQALNNNDSRTLSGLQNRLMTEFGDPRLTTFNAIANAYNHEVGSVVAKNHITNEEVKTSGATMPSNANLDTINSVATAYQQLMQSKADNLMTQYEQGRKGQPAFPSKGGTANTGVKVGDKVTLKNGQTITVKAVHPDGSFD